MQGAIGPNGNLGWVVIHAEKPPLSWRVRNRARLAYLRGWLGKRLAGPFNKLTDVATAQGELKAIVKHRGQTVNYGVLGYQCVTDAGVAYLVDDWMDGSTEMTNMKYHAFGTGTNAEAASQMALQTEVGVRVAGTQTSAVANALVSVATMSVTDTWGITEHGILSASAAGTLWDRTLFSAINLVSGDSIQFTYTCTVSASG